MKAAYVDASALVKLFKPEPETAALHEALVLWPLQVSSELIRVEAISTARRLRSSEALARAEAALELVSLIPASPGILELATREHSPPLRAMDAIHLATALSVREELGTFFVYDNDLHAAADAHDLAPAAPGEQR